MFKVKKNSTINKKWFKLHHRNLQLLRFLNEENILWILFTEADAKSTWILAMTKCRQQCSTIESDTTILKQHYLKVNEQFWLPAAVYKTTWTEQLGMWTVKPLNKGRSNMTFWPSWAVVLYIHVKIIYYKLYALFINWQNRLPFIDRDLLYRGACLTVYVLPLIYILDINTYKKNTLSTSMNWNKRWRIPKGQSKMDNREKLSTLGTRDEDKQNTNTT